MNSIQFGGPGPMGFAPAFMGGMFSMLLIWIVLLFVLSGVLMWLWNITITRIFNIREITYWEALRLLIIAAILFGKIGFNL
jgi:hypothetical protein